MKPNDFQRLSVLYLYGELSGKEKEAFEKHLAECEGCRKEFGEMKETVGLLEKVLFYSHMKVFQYGTAAIILLAVLITLAGYFSKSTPPVAIKPVPSKTAGIGHVAVKPSPSKTPLIEEVAVDISKLSGTSIDSKIKELKSEVRSAQEPELGFSDSIDFYRGDTATDDARYSPFIDSRPYRNIAGLQSEADQVRRKILTL